MEIQNLKRSPIEIDEQLVRAGVYFLPWIGSEYWMGYRGSGHRLLILGEAHYRFDGPEQILEPTLTRSLVEGVILREKRFKNFFYYIEQTIQFSDVKTTKGSDGNEFWNSVTYYNFIQSPVGEGPRHRPKRKQWLDGVRPYHGVLNNLRPDRVWILGKGLWNWTPGDESLKRGAVLQGTRTDNGHISWCMATDHPSSFGYSWKKIHAEVAPFIFDRTLERLST